MIVYEYCREKLYVNHLLELKGQQMVERGLMHGDRLLVTYFNGNIWTSSLIWLSDARFSLS